MSRFERKILVAILLVALGPLLGSLVLARGALRDAYQIGVNETYQQAIAGGVEAHRRYLMTLRDQSERTADAVAATLGSAQDRDAQKALMQAAMDRYPEVVGVTLTHGDDELAAVRRQDAVTEPMRETTRRRTVVQDGEQLDVGVHVAVRQSEFTQLERAGEISEVYTRLLNQSASVSRVYVWVYAAFLSLVIAIALIAGVILSRRVTQRVTTLARATRKVGAGDLTVTLPTGTNDEVTELTQAFNDMVRDLRDSRSRIEYLQRIGAWQEFARRLAHEIKNPLTPIQLAAQEMDQTYAGVDNAFREKLRNARLIIEEEVATLRRLVSEFSNFAKLPEADLEPAELGDFMQSVRVSVPAILQDVGKGDPSNVEVEVTCATEPLPVRIDPMMLKRCVDNLVRNAVQAVHAKYPESGGRVWVRASERNNRAVVEIEDNGPGIPTKDWDRAFDPYFTTKSDGTGLGLAIVKKVILEHDGEVRLGRSEAGGARFLIDLPLRAAG